MTNEAVSVFDVGGEAVDRTKHDGPIPTAVLMSMDEQFASVPGGRMDLEHI